MAVKIIKPKLLELADNAWLGLGDLSKIKRGNPLIKRSQWDIENPGLHEVRLMKDPKYLHFAAKILLDIDLLPMQAAILEELWIRPFPIYVAARGQSKSFTLAVYAMLKLILVPDHKIIIVGAAFRQARVIFEYMETIWRNAYILKSLCNTHMDGPKRDVDRCTFRINSSVAIAIPLGTGEKIRGLRAHTIICDEFNSVPVDIYETVIAGFTAVSASPVANVKEAARREALKKMGIWTADAEQKYKAKGGNQAILSGTAGYDFEAFAGYWKRYREIIRSKGDPRKLADILGEDNITENFDWRDYSIIRIPYKLIPEGFMDDKQIIRAKATMHSGIYDKEYGAVFVKDSDGFFKRSLIESCVSHQQNVNQIVWPSWCPQPFEAKTRGSSKYQYVIGVDPASEHDNFSIVVLELHQEHTRVVHCWSTNRKDFRQRLKSGLVKEHDFYGFCARKIRDLMIFFPNVVRIGMDAQGGGVAVEEALHDPDKLKQGELAIWPIIEDKEKDTDDQPGLHILELCQFAKADWTSEANHGLRKDFEDKVLLFSHFDTVSLGLSAEDDKRRKDIFEKTNPGKKFNIYDSLEDCVMEIEELKDELSSIVYTRTGTGVNSRDRWDTPEVKLLSGKKGRLRKDRYSALVIANMLARQMNRALPETEYDLIGDFSNNIGKQTGQMYDGPEWFTNSMGGDFGFGITRK